MKYYSEETVKRLLENKVYHTLKDCPSIEIPDKHGRLIDADTLADEFYIQLTVDSPYMQRSVADEMVKTVSIASQIAPTVLEASI